MARLLSVRWSLLLAGVMAALFEVALHLFFNLDVGIARYLLFLYTARNGDPPFGKGPWVLFDAFLPAAIGGFVLGRTSKPLARKMAWLASGALGCIIAVLMTVYPTITHYELWWLPNNAWKLARLVLLYSLFTTVGCRLAVEFGQRVGHSPVDL